MLLVSGFEEHVNIIEERLRKKIVISEAVATIHSSFHNKMDGILTEDKKRRGRSDEAIRADIITGMVAEIGIAQLLGVSVYDEVWKLNDPHSYGKDVIYRGVRLEIKSHKHLRHFTVGSKSFDTLMMLREHQTYDLILFAHVERAEEVGYWKVTPTLIVDPYPNPEYIEFRDLWDRDDYSQVYRADLAFKRNLCFPFIDLEA